MRKELTVSKHGDQGRRLGYADHPPKPSLSERGAPLPGSVPEGSVLVLQHVLELEAGLGDIQRNLLDRLQALLSDLSPEDPMHEHLDQVMGDLQASVDLRVRGGARPQEPDSGATPSVGRPSAFQAWKPPARSVARRRPRSRSEAAARLEL
jgi:hypothetical protein